MTPGILLHSRHAGLAIALRRTEDVIFGSAVALLVSYAAAALHARWQERENESSEE